MHSFDFVKGRVKTPHSPNRTETPKSGSISRSNTNTTNNVELPEINLSNISTANKKKYEIDFIGTGTCISVHNILQKRCVEPIKRTEAQLSARGLKHRSLEFFERDVISSTNYIHNQLRLGTRDTKANQLGGIQLLNVYFQRALGNERLGNVDKALQDYTTCIHMNDNYAPAYFNRSALLDAKGDIDGAAKDLLKAVTLDPGNLTYRTNRAIILRRRGEYKEAIKDTVLCKAIRDHPSLANEIETNNGNFAIDADQLTEETIIPEDPIIATLSLPKSQRNNVDCVCDFLRVSVKFFAGFKDDPIILEKIAKRLDLNYYVKGDFIFEEGDVGLRFYVIFDGEIAIVKTKKNSDNQTIIVKHLVTIVRGGTFGETALAKRGGLRSAAAVAVGKVTLLSLNVDDYNSIVTQYKTLLRNEIKIVLSSSAAFLDWDQDRIESLANEAVVLNYTANQVLMKAGEPSKKLYIIKHGVAQILKAVHHPLKNLSEHDKPRYDATGIETPGLWIIEKNWKDRMNTFDKAPIITTDNDGNENIPIQSDMVPFVVGVLGSGQVFGELAILDPEKSCPVSVVSCTNIELYSFDSDLLISLGARFNGNTINSLNESMNLCNVCFFFFFFI